MNASAPPPNLEDRHAATIARLLVLLDQLLCAIGEQARLPWYARWLVPARAMRAGQAWGQAWIEGLKGAIITVYEQTRGGAFDDATRWDAPAGDAPSWNDLGAAHDAACPGERDSSVARVIETMTDGAAAAGDPGEPSPANSQREATGPNPRDEGACRPTADETVALGDPRENDWTENDWTENGSPEVESPNNESPVNRSPGAEPRPQWAKRARWTVTRPIEAPTRWGGPGWRGRWDRPPDGLLGALPCGAGRSRAGPRESIGDATGANFHAQFVTL